MAGSGDVLGRGTVLEGEDGLGDHLTSVGSDDPSTEYLISLLAGENLDETLNILVATRSTVGIKWEGTLIILDTLLNKLFFAEADVGDLGVSIDDTGDGVVVDMTTLADQVLDGGDTLLFGLMGEHGAVNDVTNSVDMRLLGLPRLVNFDLAPLVGLEAGLLKIETTSEWLSTDRQKHDISGHLLVALRATERNGNTLLLVVDTASKSRVDLEVHALLLERLLELGGHLLVEEGADALSVLDDGNLGSETAVNGAHLEADNATTDDDHGLGNLLESESTGRADDVLLVHVKNTRRKLGRLTAGSDDNVLGLDLLGTAFVKIDTNRIGAREFTPASHVVDLVFLE